MIFSRPQSTEDLGIEYIGMKASQEACLSMSFVMTLILLRASITTTLSLGPWSVLKGEHKKTKVPVKFRILLRTDALIKTVDWLDLVIELM